MSRKILFLTGSIGAVAAIVLWAWSPWVPLRYHGDGKFADQGFFNYPRYGVTFADVPLNETGERQFHFRGLPNKEMGLRLVVKNRQVNAMADRAPLENLPVTIEAALTDDKGRVICHVSGRPAPSNKSGVWVLMSAGVAAYWQHGCNDVQVDANRSYELTVRVTDVEPGVESVVVAPVLAGGGEELP